MKNHGFPCLHGFVRPAQCPAQHPIVAQDIDSFILKNPDLESKMNPKALALAALTVVSGAVFAQAAPETTLTYNAGVVTDYRYRGITQSRNQAAVQGGVDYAHKSGFYVGAWASTIKWIADNSYTPNSGGALTGTDITGNVELDLYGGYKFDLAKDVTMDVGYLRYQYQGNNLEMTGGTARSAYGNANTNEVYTAITMGPITAKYSYSLGDLFGYIDSKGSGYLDLSANFEVIPSWTVTPHVGRQTVNYTVQGVNASYNDMSLTVTKDFGKGLTTSLAYHGTNAEGAIYSSSFDGKYLGDRGAVLGVKYSF
jgi:uncharacterized protein (TIGR02001 family)